MNTFEEYLDSQKQFINNLTASGCASLYITMMNRGKEKLSNNPKIINIVDEMTNEEKIEFLKSNSYRDGGIKELYDILEDRIKQTEVERVARKQEYDDRNSFDGDNDELSNRIQMFLEHGTSSKEAVQLATDRRFNPNTQDADGFFVRPSEHEQAHENDKKGYWSMEVPDVWYKENMPMLQHRYVIDEVPVINDDGSVDITTKQHERWVNLYDDFLNRRMALQPIGNKAQKWIERIQKINFNEMPKYNAMKDMIKVEEFNWREQQMIWASWRGRYAMLLIQAEQKIHNLYRDIMNNSTNENKRAIFLEQGIAILKENQMLRGRDKTRLAQLVNTFSQQIS